MILEFLGYFLTCYFTIGKERKPAFFRCIMVDLWVSYVTIGFGSFKKMSASSFAFFVMQKAKKIFMTLDKSGKLDQPEFSSCYIFLCVAKLKNAWIMIKSIVSFTFFLSV